MKEMKHYLIKIGVILDEKQGHLLKFTQWGKNKAEALFNVFKEFDLLEVIKSDHKEVTKYNLVNYEINEIE